MSQPHRQAKSQAKGVWPIEATRYDRSAELTALEQEALNHLLAEWGDKQRYTVPKALARQLLRLLQPLDDLQDALGFKGGLAPVSGRLCVAGCRSTRLLTGPGLNTSGVPCSPRSSCVILVATPMPRRIGNRAINSSPSPTVWDLKPISCFPSSRRSPRSPSLICSLGKNCWTRRSRGLPKCS